MFNGIQQNMDESEEVKTTDKIHPLGHMREMAYDSQDQPKTK
ncbi:hypothetical protein [Paenibacillus prosopidis]|uniref:Uncharacterized protein n=1 Tax=Paenibacillus prosopidis TaxID=630520 RepID=A0A368VZR2_9BACL|nr:hypothetical protein [Paenibacillus prosopidis]RCW47909.1 hypothetical protein DFP97_107109 [Paenibacillus prosopidis]